MNILITGITGSGGSYLAEHILQNYPEVNIWGTSRWHSTSILTNTDKVKDKIKIKECDLLDLSSIFRLLEESNPDRIFHLAATANVRTCFDTPLSTYQNNVTGTANLFEAVKMICPFSIIQLCSTSEVYGNPEEYPMTEFHKIIPVNPYAASKASQEALAYAWGQSWNLKIIITRAFCYINPRRKDLFATSFAMQVAKIEAGKQKILKHGNLESIRTIMDIRDMTEAYWMACEKCDFLTPYNIGGQNILSVGEFLEILKSKATTLIPSEQDTNLLRPKDVTRQVPDVSKFYIKTGWKQKYTLEQSIEWLLENCRKEVSNEN